MTSLLMESKAMNSAFVPPEPLYEPVTPFFMRLMPIPTGIMELTTLIPGLLFFTPVMAILRRATSGPGSDTMGYLSFSAFTISWLKASVSSFASSALIPLSSESSAR
ncbi:MAG: hypothetical protein A4E62_03220 [Syntrophorhabdus sp. PtaU1.Bin002]|nr:MAG: hypothetical protein A4E62_03220 [Syntrophorhabdus sp. PtaU1.Bin002]